MAPQSYLDEVARRLAGHPYQKRYLQAVLGEREVGACLANRLQELGVPLRGRILEVGCGEGGITIELQRHGFETVGLEIDPARIDLSKRRAEEEGVKPLFVRGSAYALPVAQGSLDAVVLENVIEHLEYWPGAVEQSARTLRPGGVIVVSLPHRFGIRTILADPHWGVFGIVLLPRRPAAFLLTKILRRPKDDSVYEMPSLRRIKRVFAGHGIDLHLSDGYDRLVYKTINSPGQGVKAWITHALVQGIGRFALLRGLYRLYRRHISMLWILEGTLRRNLIS